MVLGKNTGSRGAVSAFGTFHWLQARTMFTLDQKADYERQLRREGMELNDLEAATQRLWQE